MLSCQEITEMATARISVAACKIGGEINQLVTAKVHLAL